ncbi:arginyltransferase [Sphingomonas lacunae]|uniref:Aspartate/glutamate leucyltransferase n=1 Tax=Sphingomonas lacunae TaxID=2698828 RepID=A0A6M4AXF8_9SPHN|nr:arginyltransferase [Sphingomonas lacunae]QJQ33804.1 arginyltransferase [Sphingomonas lacunae]
MTAPFRFPRFFVTSPSPCPYLPGRSERKVFTELTGSNAAQLNDALGRIGFRRSQNVAYRPSCLGCTACVSVRVAAGEFKPSSSQKRTLKAHADLIVEARAPWATEEQYELLTRYLASRHPTGGMADMSEEDFAGMVEHSPVESCVVEYREPNPDGSAGRLVGACLTDRQGDGLSMVYSFFETNDSGRKGLGTFIILDHIVRAARAGLPYVYLGYWIEGSDRMGYKTRFQPLERLGPDGWARMAPVQRTGGNATVRAEPAKEAEAAASIYAETRRAEEEFAALGQI